MTGARAVHSRDTFIHQEEKHETNKLGVLATALTMIAQPGWSQAPTEQPAEAAAPAPKPPAAASAPAPKPPTFETKKIDGTDNVYVFRYGNSRRCLSSHRRA
jgi:hypothetical protein